ncbi:hypothetical protein VTP01DRAFT_7855 [Rhizomucor pusillus]|uniref:uncharacterized protein n=1 Tax=Rhizomucor pusillus TaxID=4840 RepID=UPI0037448BF2
MSVCLSNPQKFKCGTMLTLDRTAVYKATFVEPSEDVKVNEIWKYALDILGPSQSCAGLDFLQVLPGLLWNQEPSVGGLL